MSALGLRQYARHRRASGLTGGTLRAVQEAIESGRLSASLTADRTQIASAEAADREWAASTYEDRIPISGPGAVASPETTPTPHDGLPPPLAVSRARKEAALAELAERELAAHKGELINAEAARRDVASAYAIVRTRLLGIATQARQRDPSFTTAQLALIDGLVRDALEELADGLDEDADEGDEGEP